MTTETNPPAENTPADSQDWPAIQKWRGTQRLRLQQQRKQIPRAERSRIEADIHALLRQHMVKLRGMTIGFYWPIKGEIDLRALLMEFVEELGAVAALPIVTQKWQPLLFSRWDRNTKMQRGDWNIPVPAKPEPVQPAVLLAPLLGFDAGGYRLGFGGGYYDMTLAALQPKPLTIGIGLDAARMATIYPQPHDIPMDAIVTQSGCQVFASPGTIKQADAASRVATHYDQPDLATLLEAVRPAGAVESAAGNDSEDEGGERRTFASSPCYLAEFDQDQEER